MFGKRKKMERMTQMIQAYKPTSKAALKQYCILVAQGDVDEAMKLYDFFIRDMEQLPMFDPEPVGWLDNTKNTISGIFDLLNQNRDGIAQTYEIIRGFMSARGKNLPPITTPTPTNVPPLPPINE